MVQKAIDDNSTLRTQLEAHLRTFSGLMATVAAQARAPEPADGRPPSAGSAPKRASPSGEVDPEGRRTTRSVSKKK
jgi:hypothetical protein